MAIAGNWMALFLVDVLERAISEIESDGSDPKSLLEKLRISEEADYEIFRKSDLMEMATATIGGVKKQLLLPGDFDHETFYRGASFCHTARLPAEIRNLGILTETSSFDSGMTSEQANATRSDEGPLPLVWFPSEKDRQQCSVPLNIDHRDGFYVHGQSGWKSLTVPNNAEMQMYGTGQKLEGLIMACYKWYPDTTVGTEGQFYYFNEGLEIEVNGISVENVTIFDDCGILKHEHGHKWKPNKEGRFDIRVRVNDKDQSVEWSSIGVW
jgi:hypothetical protein